MGFTLNMQNGRNRKVHPVRANSQNRFNGAILWKTGPPVYETGRAILLSVAVCCLADRSSPQPFDKAQGVLGIHMVHERFTTILIGHLIDEAEPVVEYCLGGVAPGIVKMRHEFRLHELRHRTIIPPGTSDLLAIAIEQLCKLMTEVVLR